LVDFVRHWGEKSEIPNCRLLGWIGIGAGKFHDWKLRFGKVNEHNAWIPRDHWLTPEERARILAFARNNPLEGYRRLTYMMIDANVVACSPASTYRVLKAAGMLAGSTPVPSKKGTGFVQPLAPHEHWHVDISYINVAGTFLFLCGVLDGCSRYITHWEIREKMEERDVETIVQKAREAHPGANPRIITDNGPQFIAKDFKEFIRMTGMTHVRTSPYYPQSNGKIERWHKTLKADCIRPQVPLSLDDARRLVDGFVKQYNTKRLHSAIGYVTPVDKLHGKDKAILQERDRRLAEAREQRRALRQTRHEERGATSQRAVANNRTPARRPIDFAAVRSIISIGAVLQLLGFRAQSAYRGQQRGPCPLHGSTSSTSRCFSANEREHVFQCFKCGRAGNALDLWAMATKQPPYEAAVDLCGRLHLPVPYSPTSDANGDREEEPVPSLSTSTVQ
jgi:transposase InsO family protein